MKPLVSVIIPVYNAANYLQACIDSLCHQTLQEMEFLFVDDCSQDQSLQILRQAESLDPRIRVFPQPVNSGVSAARNRGIRESQGDYVGFCDADDWVEPEMFETLLAACRDNGSQMSFCRVFKDRPQGQLNVPLGFDDGTCFNEAEIRSTLIPAMISLPRDGDGLPLSGYTPRNLFARTLLQDISFREDIHYAEDLLFIIQCALKCTGITAVDRAFYHYRFYEGSVTKHYSPYIPDSFDKSNDALQTVLSAFPECLRRMDIRRRKMAVDVIRNFCLPGTPLSFSQRVRQSRSYMNRPDTRALFRPLQLRNLSLRPALRLGLMKYRMAFLSCLLYSTVFRGFA